MARYIKANPKVAQFLHLENDRNQVKDGNYLLWQNDMLAFGRLTDLPQTLEKIGGIVLAAHEAREEQDGTVSRELPTATDPRFVVEQAAEEVEETTGTEEVEQPVETETEEATPSEYETAEAEESTESETEETTTNETEE